MTREWGVGMSVGSRRRKAFMSPFPHGKPFGPCRSGTRCQIGASHEEKGNLQGSMRLLQLLLKGTYSAQAHLRLAEPQGSSMGPGPSNPGHADSRLAELQGSII